MPSEPTAPPPEIRPKLWRFYRERNLSAVQVGRVCGRTREWVRLITLPFDDPKRQTPSPDDIAKLHDWSGGEIGPADWYPPRLSPSDPTRSVESAV